MKRIIIPVLILIGAVLFDSCTSGKVAYEKGNYDEAVLKAISRLRKNPNNKKASQTLMEAYPLTISWHQDNVNRAIQSNNDFKWERVVSEYKQVNYLYNQLNRCPACLRLVTSPVHYVAELNDAREKAAAIRYQRGEELLARVRTTHNRSEAIEAYRHFEVACSLMGEYKDARDKLAEAKFLATLKVVVEPIPAHRNLEISHEFFENKILEFVESMQVNEFVEFYSYTEAKNIGLENPDQIIQLQFDEFVLGQVYLKEREVQQSKDSVVLAVIKAQRQIEHGDALVANLPNSSAEELFRYYKPHPIIASPILDTDPERGGSNNKKVTVCHKIPGSMGKSQTLSISKNALEHHLDHGDVQGTCSGEPDNTQSTETQQNQQPTTQPTITTTYQTNTSSSETVKTSTGTKKSTSTTAQEQQPTTTQQSTAPAQSTTTVQQSTTPVQQSTTPVQQSTAPIQQSAAPVQSANTGKSNADLSSLTNGTTSAAVSQSDPKPTERKVYGTVKATVHVFNKSLTSKGILDFKIIDAHNQRVLSQEKMPGEFVWYTEWGYFNGDERALDEYFLEVVKLKEAYPPPPQDLFVAFTQPIFGQVTSKIRDFYRNY